MNLNPNRMPVFIPERFKRSVFVHIFKNMWSEGIQSVPLILGIHGPSGWGKTFQCERLLHDLGVKVFLISGGQFEHKDAGEPARLLRQTYRDAGSAILDKEAKFSVLLINDVDAGLGNWGDNVQTTINTQVVISELMHITDYPTIVDNKNTLRIPIIMTGNDFTKLYEPLIRAGRMVSFEWIPTLEEKIRVVTRIFPELSEKESACLVNELHQLATNNGSSQGLNIAFFSYLRSVLYDDYVWAIITRYGAESLLSQNLSKHPAINIQVNYFSLLQKGKELIASSHYINHLMRSA